MRLGRSIVRGLRLMAWTTWQLSMSDAQNNNRWPAKDRRDMLNAVRWLRIFLADWR